MILTRLQFGLPAEPWLVAPPVATADATRVGHWARAAVKGCAWVSMVGPRGSGKTRALRIALAAIKGVAVIQSCRLDRKRLHIGDVVSALVAGLSNESPRRGGEARSAQVRRLLGHADRSVVLLIDDMDELHQSTLRSLKRLRELSWRGRSPLLSIVLAGQADRPGEIPEVGLRTATMQLAGLTQREAEEAIPNAVGKICTPEAAAQLAASDRARNWLDLERLVDDCLMEAVARGETTITAAAAGAVLGDVARPAVKSSAPAAATTIEAVLDGHEGAGQARRKKMA